jgi:hypothetical protein
MSPDPASTTVEDRPQSGESRPKSAQERLSQIERELQSRVRRKLKGYQLTALRDAARMALRAELCQLDPKSNSMDLVRVQNAARRARMDFEALCGIEVKKPKQRTHEDVMREAFPS